MGHPEPKTIKETTVTVNVSVTYNGATKFNDAVDMGDVPEGEYTAPPDAGVSGSSLPFYFGEKQSIGGEWANGIINTITIPTGGNGNYKIDVESEYYLGNETTNQTIWLKKNGTNIDTNWSSKYLASQAIGYHRNNMTFFVTGLVAGDVITVNVIAKNNSNIEITNNINNIIVQSIASKTTTVPSTDIPYTFSNGAGGA